jgi:hypothetical protein
VAYLAAFGAHHLLAPRFEPIDLGEDRICG